MAEWFIWRVVLSGKATLREIEESWTLKELCDAHEVLDVQAEAEDLTYRHAAKGR